MDRLVKVECQDLILDFKPNHRCTTTFRLTNLMHTMSVAISLTTTTPSIFTLSNPLTVLPPLSSSFFSLTLTSPSPTPPLSSPFPSLLVRTSILPIGKAPLEDLRRLFSKPSPYIFKDATLPISFVGDHVVEFLLSSPPTLKTLEISFLLSKAISSCSPSQLTSLLSSAVKSGNPSFVSTLIDSGADLNVRDSSQRSLLYFPIRSGDTNLVRLLIESGCKIDQTIDFFLHDAAEMNRADVMAILLQNSSKIASNSLVNSLDSIGRTPVHVSAFHGHVEALKLCVSMGGEPDCVDEEGWTPLHCAAAGGHVECVKYLVECCIYSKYAITKDGKTPFLLAMDNGHLDLFEVLKLQDALNRAVRVDDVNGVKGCIEAGVDVNGKDQNGWTPLHRAAFKGRVECVKVLLSNGAKIDVVDDVGYTPLHCAVEAGQVEVALCLMAHGACGSSKTLKGVCSLNLGSFKNHPAFVSPMHSEMELA